MPIELVQHLSQRRLTSNMFVVMKVCSTWGHGVCEYERSKNFIDAEELLDFHLHELKHQHILPQCCCPSIMGSELLC